MQSKIEPVETIAKFQAQLFKHKVSGIRNIYNSDYPEHLGQMVSTDFFWGDHIKWNDIPHGPFSNSKEWFDARLQFVLRDQGQILENFEDEDEIENSENAKAIAERLVQLLPGVLLQEASRLVFGRFVLVFL